MKSIKSRKFFDSLLKFFGLFTLLAALGVLSLLLESLFQRGQPMLHKDFFFNFPSYVAERSGILSAWVGSLSILLTTLVIAVPVAIGAAIYLEEYAAKNRFSDLIEVSVSNLAGVPSIVFGLLALGLFVYRFHLGASILTAALTLSLLVLPIIIVATREALRAVPQSLREAALAMGATRWQCVWHHILPSARGGVVTGVIIAFSRAIGETAPLVTIGALSFISFLPSSPVQPHFPFLSFAWLKDPFTVMPVQIFNWTSRPQEEFQINAAAASVALVVLALLLNLIAIVIRFRSRRSAE